MLITVHTSALLNVRPCFVTYTGPEEGRIVRKTNEKDRVKCSSFLLILLLNYEYNLTRYQDILQTKIVFMIL
jgi:hypothetical protein